MTLADFSKSQNVKSVLTCLVMSMTALLLQTFITSASHRLHVTSEKLLRNVLPLQHEVLQQLLGVLGRGLICTMTNVWSCCEPENIPQRLSSCLWWPVGFEVMRNQLQEESSRMNDHLTCIFTTLGVFIECWGNDLQMVQTGTIWFIHARCRSKNFQSWDSSQASW